MEMEMEDEQEEQEEQEEQQQEQQQEQEEQEEQEEQDEQDEQEEDEQTQQQEEEQEDAPPCWIAKAGSHCRPCCRARSRLPAGRAHRKRCWPATAARPEHVSAYSRGRGSP